MPKGEQMASWFVGVTRSHPWFFFNNFASREDWQQSTRGLCQIWLEARECFSNPTIYWQHTRTRVLNFFSFKFGDFAIGKAKKNPGHIQTNKTNK